MTHRAQVVDFIGLGLLYDADQVGSVAEVAIMQEEVGIVVWDLHICGQFELY